MSARTATEARTDTRRRLLIAIAMFLLVSAFVVRTSDAAFTATYENEDNLFATASIDLDSDATAPLFGDDGAGALIHSIALYPGVEVNGCIDIEYLGDLRADDLESVELEIVVDPLGNDDDLAQHLAVTIVALDDDCDTGAPDSTFVADVPLDGVGDGNDTGWTPDTDGETRGFEFTVEVTGTGNDIEMGDEVTDVDVIWSLQTSS